ncbi:MAG: hypothetical protein ACRBN8_03325 [Nannocystales bacterium]
MTRLAAVFLGLCVLAPSLASASERPRIREDVPWALHPGDDLDKTPMERAYGIDEDDLPPVDSFWDGTLLYTRDSAARDTLAQQGLPPLHAVAYDPSPGVLYVAMQGITLIPTCTGGDTANAAKRCSPLVDVETSFPAAGSSQQQAALFNQLADFYEPFDLVLTTSEPPDWMPYTMAVIGGTAGNAGQPGGVCGVANVACDGLKRNHVSLTFPGSCGGSAETAAQETAHNWGLEHTDNNNDLLYPFNSGGNKSFVDQCMTISHATGDGVTQCDYIHEEYCPSGGGEQQNTYQELLGIFGPRTPDNQAPEIVSIFPEDGATFTTEDTFTPTARIQENSNFVGVKWSLESEETALSRCTNNVCDQPFNPGVGFDPNEIDWQFTTLTTPPAGEYVLRFEVLDSYGGYATETITVHVVEAEGGSGDPTTEGGSETDGDSAPGSGTGEAGSGSGGSVDEPTESSPDDDDDGPAMETDGVGLDDDDQDGCACNVRQSEGHGFLALMLLGLTLRRRRTAG